MAISTIWWWLNYHNANEYHDIDPSVIICEKLSWYFNLLVSFLARHATYAAFIMLSFLLDAPPSREELWNNSKLNICLVSFCYKHGAFVGLDRFEIWFSTSDLDLWPFFQIYENQPKMKSLRIALIDVCLGVAIWRWKQDILTKQELLARYIHWADLPNMWFVDSSMSCFFYIFLVGLISHMIWHFLVVCNVCVVWWICNGVWKQVVEHRQLAKEYCNHPDNFSNIIWAAFFFDGFECEENILKPVKVNPLRGSDWGPGQSLLAQSHDTI